MRIVTEDEKKRFNLDQFEKQFVLDCLTYFKGNRTLTSIALGISSRFLRVKAKRYGWVNAVKHNSKSIDSGKSSWGGVLDPGSAQTFVSIDPSKEREI